MKQTGLPVIGIPAGDTSALEDKMLSALARLAALEGKVDTLDTLKGKMSTLEGKVSTLKGKMSTLEGKMSTLEGKVGAFQDALNLAPMILYNAEGAGDASVKVLASSDDTEKVSFEYAVVADYKPGSQDSYRFSRATYTGATTTTERFHQRPRREQPAGAQPNGGNLGIGHRQIQQVQDNFGQVHPGRRCHRACGLETNGRVNVLLAVQRLHGAC